MGRTNAVSALISLYRAAAIAAVISAASLPICAQAMRVSPMVVEMQTTGANAVARVQVQNINQADLPFETKITQLEFDDNGNTVEKPADGDFLVFPPQGLLKAGQRQVVRVQWLGGADLPASRAYYISVNQLPVALAPGAANTAGAQVQIVYHMKALIVVAPPRAAPKVAVVSAKPTMITPKAPQVPEGVTAGSPAADLISKPGVEVLLSNTGKRYAMMAGARWTIKGKGKDGKPLSVIKDPEALNRELGVGYLAPLNGRRTFRVLTDTAFGPGPITVEFSN